MAFQSAHLLGRAASGPLTNDVAVRHSLDCSSPVTARSRGASFEVRAVRSDPILATSLLSTRSRDTVHLEVGRSVDLNEQRRILEQYWNTEEPSAQEEASTEEEVAGSNPRSHLEQRWQSQNGRQDPALTARHRSSRSKHFSSLSRLRVGRRNVRCKSRPAGYTQLPARRKSDSDPPEVSNLQFLQRLSRNLAPPGSENRRLLDRAAELRLGEIVQLGLQLRATLDARERELGHLLSPEEQEQATELPIEHINLRLSNRHQAQQLFVAFNGGLLNKVARAFEGRGLEMEDLMVEGTQGLEKAVLRFDPSKGYRFSTYAYMWIRQAISRSITENARLVRLPGHVNEMLCRIQKVRELLSNQPHAEGEAGDEQVAAAMGLPVEKVALYVQASRAPASLEHTVQSSVQNQTEAMSLGEVMQDTTPTADDELVEEDSVRLLKQDIDNVLSGLSLRERNVLRYRYGLHTEAVSLSDLSAAYGVSQERIRSIGEVALAKLQLRQASNGKLSSTGRVRNVPILRPELYGYHGRSYESFSRSSSRAGNT